MTDDIRHIIPQFPDNLAENEIHHWDAAACLQSPGQYPAILKLTAEHARMTPEDYSWSGII